MHVNKANRGRQERREKATKRGMVGGKIHKPYREEGEDGRGRAEESQGWGWGGGSEKRGCSRKKGSGGSGPSRVDANGLKVERWGHRE